VAGLPATAGVVVVGGGVIGVSTAFHLAEAGVDDVLLLDRGALGSGSTVKAAGGVRAQFSDELNIRLAARSLELLGQFGQRPGQEIDLQRVGYLWLLDDGHCTPESVVLGYASAARRLGARLLTGVDVTGIRTSGGEVHAVVTDRGEVQTGTVVCAAGAWSAAVGGMVGVDLPVVPLRRQVLVTAPVPDVPPDLPFTIDFSTSLYFHREGRGLLVGMSDPDEQPGFQLGRSDAWLPRLAEAVERRAPRLLDAGLAGGWAGLYEVTPDANALVGQAPDVSRFLYATGFSGHGFLMGPATGEVVRDLVLGRVPFVDLSPLDARRFARGAARPERALV
jgi:sarcosine oxidase subunit beta